MYKVTNLVLLGLVVSCYALPGIQALDATPISDIQRRAGRVIPRPTFKNSVDGIATFNNYTDQLKEGSGTTACRDKTSAREGLIAGAVGDVSPDLRMGDNNGECTPEHLFNKKTDCGVSPNEFEPISSYQGPNCSQTYCDDLCYSVTSKSISTEKGRGDGNHKELEFGNTIIMEVVDVCPASHAQNACKSPEVHLGERCMDRGKNALDIDFKGYRGLTGVDYDPNDHFPNLAVEIRLVDCAEEEKRIRIEKKKASSN